MSGAQELVTVQEWRATRRKDGPLSDLLHLGWTLPGSRFAPTVRTVGRRAGVSAARIELEPWEVVVPLGSTPAVLARVHEDLEAGRPIQAVTAEGVHADGSRFRRTAGFTWDHVDYLTKHWPPAVQLRAIKRYEDLPLATVRALVRGLTVLEQARRVRGVRAAPSWT